MSTLQRLTVFTGAAPGLDPRYVAVAAELGGWLAESGIELVYGGGTVGMMGALADAVLAGGGRVTGVMPEALMERELAHRGITTLEVVPDMHARKSRMAELADGFVALPGGAGTLEEFFEVWTWQRLGFHDKPVALYDVAGFWQPLLGAVESMATAGFLSPGYQESLVVAQGPAELTSVLASWRTPATTWRA
ncbi:TIGR00730 family Rossman fold protein [Cellulomonas denverensis]|uniref:LOG family protein n=1 Tax=Cellulomonas denverensis TaxID=264297 RepID=UPI001A5FAFC3|nr:TIGR00730 family Rossman fold protein [Cellulomonas denverensis]GIG25552.1 cytokinin riboside 5'-monophosphate phosphoribohydrolase [Cellulomonas denverensis]